MIKFLLCISAILIGIYLIFLLVDKIEKFIDNEELKDTDELGCGE